TDPPQQPVVVRVLQHPEHRLEPWHVRVGNVREIDRQRELKQQRIRRAVPVDHLVSLWPGRGAAGAGTGGSGRGSALGRALRRTWRPGLGGGRSARRRAARLLGRAIAVAIGAEGQEIGIRLALVVRPRIKLERGGAAAVAGGGGAGGE